MSEKLTARKENVDKLVERMKIEGYSLVDMSVDGHKVNKMSLITGAIPSVILFLLFGFICGWDKLRDDHFPLVMLVYLVSVVVHEGIHGLFFALFAKNHFKSIDFGILWKSVNPYCYCNEPVNKAQYLTALLMPGFILGLCPGIVSILISSAPMLIFSVLSLFAAGGDMYIAYMILKNTKKDREEKYLDHPSQPGLLLLVKEDKA